MTSLKTGSLDLPNSILDPWLGKIQHGSTVAALSNAIPMKFGVGQSFTFDIGEAEYVGEGAQKGSSTITPTKVTTSPYKFVKTVRWSDEVKYADEDGQAETIEQVLALLQPALSRALDFGIIHGVDPASGVVVPAMTQKLVATTNSVDYAGTEEAYELLDEADALVLAGGYVPSGVALDPALAAKFSGVRVNGQKLYPNFGFGTAVAELDGHASSVSRTVGAKGVITPDSDVMGIVGDFDAIRWGIQRQLGLELIEHGDPDGLGDLKRNNEVAFRMEVIYGWGIADVDAFAKIVDARV